MASAPVLVLIGTKAQLIKTAPVLREMDARSLPYRLVYTGQHSETFDILERAFGIRTADDVLVPRFEAATHHTFLQWTWRYWLAVLRRFRAPDWRAARWGLVHGDTASTLYGALALRMAGLRVAHVEAGLRSSRLLEPFPEELVRRLTSRLSDLHLAPDDQAVANLGGTTGSVVHTGGNTLRDALVMALRQIGDAAQPRADAYAVVSLHRNENLSNLAMLDLLMEEIVRAAGHIPLKFVLHPVTRSRLDSTGWTAKLRSHPGIALVDRMDYPDFVRLLVGSRFLLTDGGSNQEEAAMLGLPTLLLRRTTERGDGLGEGIELSGLDRQRIRDFVAARAGQQWQMRTVAGPSPSAIIVTELARHNA